MRREARPLLRIAGRTILALLAVVLVAAILFPVFAKAKSGGGVSPERRARYATIQGLTAALRDERRPLPSNLEIRLDAARANQDQRLEIARILVERGAAKRGLALVRPEFRADPYALSSDWELTAYAAVARAAGDRTEASWALGRRGHLTKYRIWRAGVVARRPSGSALEGKRGRARRWFADQEADWEPLLRGK